MNQFRLNFVVVNGDIFKEFVTTLGLKREDLPTFSIVHPSTRGEYLYPKGQQITLRNAKRWLDLYLAEKLSPHVAEIYDQYDDVALINTENWEEIVLDETKDVMVEFYSDDCRFCQLMAPHYKHLATIFKAKKKISSLVHSIHSLMIFHLEHQI